MKISRNTQWLQREYGMVCSQLFETLLPFWSERGPDREHGGVFTCFDPLTGERTSDLKFMWAQGRMLWIASELSDFVSAAAGASAGEEFALIASDLKRFLDEHARSPNGDAYFLLSRSGQPTTLKREGLGENDEFHTSTFSDCFLALGYARYAAAFNDPDALLRSGEILRAVIEKLESGLFRTHPYPEPAGMHSHGARLIPLLVAGEYLRAAERVPEAGRGSEMKSVEAFATTSAGSLRTHFLRDNGMFAELLYESGAPGGGSRAPSLLSEYANPGHTLESYGVLLDNPQIAASAGWNVTEIAGMIKSCLEIAWDEHYGGLLAFVRPGSSPQTIDAVRAESDPLGSEPLFHTVQRDWSLKLWWPHSEGMYTTLRAALAADDDELLRWYERLREYTLRTFPNREGPEWIHMRDRHGTPVRRVTGLPVKDSYHNARSFVKILHAINETLSR